MEENILKQKKKLGLSLAIFIIVSYLSAFGLTFVIKQFDIVTEKNKYLITYLINAISIYVIGFVVTRAVLGSKMQIEKKEKKKIKLSNFLLLIAITIGGSQIINIVTNAILSIIQLIAGSKINNDVAEILQGSDGISLVLFAVVLGPIFEELIYRGMFLKRLRAFGDKTAIIYTAIAFGLFHCNIAQIPFAIACGLVLGYAAVKSNNIIYPIILHMALNGTSTVLSLAMKANNYLLVFIILLLIMVCIILTLVFVPIKLATKKVKIDNESKYDKKNLYKNIGYIFAVIVVIIITIVSAIF